MARRGFFAELQYQAKVSAREAQRAQAARARQIAAAQRETERAQRAAERAAAQAARASVADQKRLAKEAKEAHQAAMQATVDQMNTELESIYAELDGLLTARQRRAENGVRTRSDRRHRQLTLKSTTSGPAVLAVDGGPLVPGRLVELTATAVGSGSWCDLCCVG